ncbi:endonuclease domain-containing protein [Streptomyces ardesiacus]|uniref:endonuclease domain-containing protein n=1 Tax=Streptomyces ardesiacus TaxID=285564 RepID=UPI00365D3B3A
MATAVQQVLDDSNGLRTCKRCNETKPEANFNKAGTGYRSSTCNTCRNERRRKIRQSGRRREAETPKERAARRLWENYKLTPKQFEALVEAQGNQCAMCGTPPPEGKQLQVDHCHTTRIVRALLCQKCNIAVGFYERHAAAVAQYLALFGEGHPLIEQAPGTTRGEWEIRRAPLTGNQGRPPTQKTRSQP